MRIFSTQSAWDVKEHLWYEIYFVDKEEVSQEEYFRELESEQCLEDDEVEEIYCQCCECPDKDNCDDFECTCICEENTEVENGNMDDMIECQCPDCVNQRKVNFLSEAVNIISDGLCCPQCLYELLESIYDAGEENGFDLGYEEAKDEMKEFLED